MVETVRFSKACLEDLALGTGTRQVRLADGAVHTLTEIHVTGLLLMSTQVLRCADFAGQPAMTWTAGLPLDRRIWGVTVKNLVALGISNGLTGYRVGDAAMPDRWSNAAFPLTLPFASDEGDFTDLSLMIYPTGATKDILLSAEGGLFDAVGQVEVAIHHSWLRHPS